MRAGQTEYSVSEVAASDWPGLLAQFPEHSIFHTLDWFQVIESEHGAAVDLAKAVDDTGRCVAIWPVLITSKGPIRIQGSPVPGWNTPYLGPLFSSDCRITPALKAFLHHDVFRRGSYFSCKVYNRGPQVDLTPFGFTEAERLETFVLDLQRSHDDLWDNLKSECRTQIRKARKLGLEIRREEDASFIDDFWAMAQETFAICSIKPTYSRNVLEQVWSRLSAIDAVRVISAFKDGERIATLFLPFDAQTMYFWAGVSFIRYRGIPAHNLLQWEAISTAHALGLKTYDFVSTAGNGGRFKKTFGPESVHIATQWERTSSWMIKALKSGYKFYLDYAQRTA